MDELIVITAGRSDRLDETLRFALSGIPHATADAGNALQNLAGRRVLFALAADEAGMSKSTFLLIAALRRKSCAMEGSIAGILLDGDGELYTKQTADQLALAANLAGCIFPGRPLVEATGSLANWRVQGKRRDVEPAEAYRLAARELVMRLAAFEAPRFAKPKILMLHASDKGTSNTLQIGSNVCGRLRGRFDVRELSLQNGTIYDCRGCSFTTCAHYAAQNSCFYGGSIVSEVYPALMACDALLLLCPNYNDSVSANIMAFINRLTSLVVFNPPYDKYLYAVVVSGYSGGDLVAQQTLGALCLNKAFMLPPRFCLLETAHYPGEAMRSANIEKRIGAFAEGIADTLLAR
jgi:multimeric flavodoxin WrbA